MIYHMSDYFEQFILGRISPPAGVGNPQKFYGRSSVLSNQSMVDYKSTNIVSYSAIFRTLNSVSSQWARGKSSLA